MADRPAKPPGMPRLSPYLTVRDAEAALAFYQKAFGFQAREHGVMKGPDGKITHAELAFHEAVIMFGPEGAYGQECKAPQSSGTPSPVSLYIYCDDVDALFQQATAAGAKGVGPPEDMFWGDRMCQVEDPDGHRWSFATNVGDFDPSKMPTG